MHLLDMYFRKVGKNDDSVQWVPRRRGQLEKMFNSSVYHILDQQGCVRVRLWFTAISLRVIAPISWFFTDQQPQPRDPVCKSQNSAGRPLPKVRLSGRLSTQITVPISPTESWDLQPGGDIQAISFSRCSFFC